MNRKVAIEDAVGLPLAHDVTEIRPGEFKGARFRKGHVVRGEDLDDFRRIGKAHLFVLDIGEDELHEDDAVRIMVDALCGPNVGPQGEPVEGKVNLVALTDGLLKVDVGSLLSFNMLGAVMCATRHTDTVVKKGQRVAGTRAIPLVIKRGIAQRAADIAAAAGGIVSVKEIKSRKVGVIVTGTEVFSGLVEDRFEGVIRRKVEALGSRVSGAGVVPDDTERIADAIRRLLDGGAEIIVATGGMSVDPDDVTRAAIVQAGGSPVLYGSAVLPGAMFLLSRIGPVPVVGVPACAIYEKATVFDLVLPRLLAGETLDRADIAALGHGGLCLNCQRCRFPNCAFGKGG
jgi:molybdenum cofactor synthesis domain-containing protein